MIVLIHVFGSDIPHRNQTALRFFSDSLTTMSGHARTFMAVSQDAGLSESYLALLLSFYSGKKVLADAVIAKAKADRQQCFLSHGQFNISPWLTLLSGGIRPARFYWHV